MKTIESPLPSCHILCFSMLLMQDTRVGSAAITVQHCTNIVGVPKDWVWFDVLKIVLTVTVAFLV